MRSSNVSVPLPLVVLGTCTLLLSFSVHLFGILLNTSVSTPSGNLREEVVFLIELPEVALVTKRSENFGLNSTFDAQWSNLTPKQTMGFVFHPKAKEFYSVAFYHQIHCLNALRKYVAEGSNLTLSYAVTTHAEHCLDYLREALFCHSDTTLEPVRAVKVDEGGASAEEGSTGVHIDQVAMGWGVTHRCRDWSVLRDYMNDNWNDWPEEYKQASAMARLT